ncbi:TPA: hypothetical protein PTV97_003425 [Clostridium botulinum]|nr:hypothetical protein [Clostridium botulinum]
MINFSDLKKKRIKKTLEFNGEKINILNPTKEVKEKIMEVVGKYSKQENGTVEIDIGFDDDPQFIRDIFQTLVEGIAFPDNLEDFKDVMENPESIVKEIQYEISNIVRKIGKENALELKHQLDSTEDLLVIQDITKKMDKFIEKNKDVNIEIPNVVIKDKKEKDITPKPKAKTKRKSTKKTKKEEKEDKIIELDESKKVKEEKDVIKETEEN